MAKSEPHYIRNTAELEDFCKSLASDAFITIDTEFIRERTYYPQLCLIQVAGENAIGVIDPLPSSFDMTPLFTLLQNPNIKKVFHSARQDLEIFYLMMKQLPQNIYDTQIAAMVCGFGESVGYETLVRHLVKKSLDKSLSISNWAHRPLTRKQINYAVGDVVYLREIFQMLAAKIKEKHRQSWIEEELAELLVEENYQPNLDRQFGRLKLKTSQPEVLARAFELIKLRESVAAAEDKPRPTILRDELIIDLAHQNPTTQNQLKKIRGLGDRLQRYDLGAKIIKAASQVDAASMEQYPKLPKKLTKPLANPMVLESLKLLLRYVAKEHEVADRIIATPSDLEHLILQRENDRNHLLKGWRYELFGHIALQFLRGELHIACKQNKVVLIPVSKENE
jgi:ribonuclease D